MHQSGHSRAQSMQTVQFSSTSAITPRERGGKSGGVSGYCRVCARWPMVLSVTASPLASPPPGTSPMTSSCPTDRYGCHAARLHRDLDRGGDHELDQRQRDQAEPAEPLQL